MEKTEFKVGDVFQCGLIKFKCVGNRNGCIGCYMYKFSNSCEEFGDIIGNCMAENREDKTDVIFVKVED